MFHGLAQSIILLVILSAFYIIDLLSFHRYDKRRKAKGRGRSWDFTTLALIVCIIFVLQPTVFPWLGFWTESGWGLVFQIVGILLSIFSLGLNAWGRANLRQFYAERVEIQPGHKVIDSGPYAWVRHPIITSFFGIAISLFLINPAATTLLGLLYTFWDFGRAARQEEKLLSENLPEYAAYMQRTPRFLPRWRRTR